MNDARIGHTTEFQVEVLEVWYSIEWFLDIIIYPCGQCMSNISCFKSTPERLTSDVTLSAAMPSPDTWWWYAWRGESQAKSIILIITILILTSKLKIAICHFHQLRASHDWIEVAVDEVITYRSPTLPVHDQVRPCPFVLLDLADCERTCTTSPSHLFEAMVVW